MKRHALTVAAVLLALAAMPASALAGTASIGGGAMTVSSSIGQTNDLTVSVSGSNFLVVETGAGATLTPGAGCASGGTNQVLCPRAGITSMTVTGSDNNDELTNTTSTPATLDGGSGSDVLTGGPAADQLVGSSGSDYVSYSGRTSTVVADLDGLPDDGQAGENDRIATDVETLVGGSANDTLTGNGATNGLDGGPGSDSLIGGTGNDYVLYWTRTNPVTVSFDGVTNDGEAGENDKLGADVESAIGGAGADTLIGNSAANQLWGVDGNDTLDGKGGADGLFGLEDVDTVLYSSRTARVVVDLDGTADDGEAGEGDNVGSDVEVVIGGAGGDTIVGDADANSLAGGAGNDSISGGGGNDSLDGGVGADVLGGGADTDHVTYASRTAGVAVDLDGAPDDGQAGEGDNVGADVENVTGGAGADTLVGDGDPNLLAGGAGNDTLDGRGGADALGGGAGTDHVTYAGRTAGVAVDLDGAADDGQAGEHDNVAADVESLTGGGGGDTLVGDGDANTLAGGGGNDTLAAGDGDDDLDGGAGGDLLGGGPGTDHVTYSARTAPVSVDLDGSGDDGEAGESDNVAADIENLSGGSASDRLVGDGGANTLVGGSGSDTLDGRGGRDVLLGTAGADELRSRDGNADDVSCGSQRDTVTGDPRDDVTDDCESVSTSATAARISLKPVRMSANGTLPIRLACPKARKKGCRGTITLVELPASTDARASRRSRGSSVGRAKFRIKRGSNKVVKVQASRHGRRRVRRKRRMDCRASAVMRAGGKRTTTTGTLTVRAPKRGS